MPHSASHMSFRFGRTAAVALMLTLAGAAAHASSDAAWAGFSAEVKDKCLAATSATLEAPRAIVDPFGSEHYGMAVITGKLKAAPKTQASMICVFNKQNKTVEIGGELPAMKAAPAKTR